MTRRIISFLLSVTILFGSVVLAAPEASAAYNMRASEKIIELIKDLEGFEKRAYSDHGQWSVGYGTGVSGAELKEYQERDITKKEADELLRRYVLDFETDLNNFAEDFKLKFSQNEFDALICFTYNLGSSWMRTDSELRRAIINRASDSEIIFNMARYCIASGSIMERLVRRRLSEANVYLNGVYNKNPPINYCYIHFDENIAEPYVRDVRIQAFDNTKSNALRSQPVKFGYRFLGWYTHAEGGEWITSLPAGSPTQDLYAHWQRISDSNASVNGTPAYYKRTVGGNVSGIVRETPSNSAAEIGRLNDGKSVTITGDYVDENGSKWGKLSTGGWIIVHTNMHLSEPQGRPITPVTVTVLQNGVNNRYGPGTNYSAKGQFNKGDELTITAVDNGGNYLWGLCSQGWICLRYTNYDLVTYEQQEDATKVTATGTVYRTDLLNVRTGPGTKYALAGQLKKGDFVTITLQRTVNDVTWGKTELGWVSLYYIELGPADAKPPAGSTTPTEKPTEPSQPEETSFTGEVVDCSELNIREQAGTKYAKVGTLKKGTRVEILAQTSVYGQKWGKIDKGWISLSYIKKVTGEAATTPETPTTPSQPEDKTDQVVDSGVIVKCSVLNVRSGAGTKNPRVGELMAGDRVNIYEKTDVRGQTWGRTDKGWISLYYFSSGTVEEKPAEKPAEKPDSGNSGTTSTDPVDGVVVNCTAVNIRANAGTKYANLGTLPRGTKVTILEQVKVNGATWGRTDMGWIHMYYIKLQAAGSGTTGGNTGSGNTGSSGGSSGNTGNNGTTGSQTMRTGTIYRTKTLAIREAAGTGNAKVGTIAQGTKVVILETTKVGGTTWGRIDQGWISLYYVQLTDEKIPEGAQVRTVTVNGLNIRSDAGTKNDSVGTYAKGTQVIILEQKDYYGQAWGRTDKGWISLNYTK